MRWRLLIDEACDGAWNMAVDTALLRSRAAGGVATLRLYGWSRPTASLGRFQPFGDVDLEACRRLGVDVVRRATGGRGVLHDDELTYSVTAAEADGVPRGVAASYRHLGAALLAAYHGLGVPAELTEGHAGRKGSAACYLAATQADLSLAGAKLSGSAQVWADGAVLQHGSFVISRDVTRESEVFLLPHEAAEALSREAVTVADATGSRPDLSAVRDAVVGGFESVLGVEFDRCGLTSEEEECARGLEASASLFKADVRAWM